MYRYKKIFLFCILFIVLSSFNNEKSLWKYIWNQANVNKDYMAVDTVWYNPENNYHNDALINTLLNNKTCVCSSYSWYAEYYKVFSERVDGDCNVPDIINGSEIDKTDFTEVGYALAYIHSTLVKHEVYDMAVKNDVPKLYVRSKGIDQTDRIVAVNDDCGNIYLMTEDYWNEIYN